MGINRIGILLLLFSYLLVACSSPPTEKATDVSQPNIVLVLADDLGYSDIGAYGSEIKTPHLDKLAHNGIRFTQMHNTSKCFPSRATLLTGIYAQQSNMHDRPETFHNSVMIGEVLKRAGYRTMFVGKHHGTDNPYNWGFDHYRGLRDGAANYFNPGLQREGEPMPAQKRYGERVFAFDGDIEQPFTPSVDYYSTESWTDWSLDLLNEYKDEEKPFLLYLAYQAPHDPLQAPEEAINKYEGVYDKGYEAIAQARYKRQQESGLLNDRYPRSEPTYLKWNTLSDSAQADQVRRMQVYAAMIDRMDQNIGRLIDQIQQMGEWENTLFLFASDNGASAEVVSIGDGPIGSMTRWSSLKEDWANVANTPFRYYKNYSYEGGTATPFIVHWPAVITQSGSVNRTPAHFIDLMPTLIDITGESYPDEYKGEQVHPMEGISLLPLFKGEAIEREDPLFFNWSDGSAIRTDRWKLVREGEEWQLFDMQTDRTETNNMADEEPEVVSELKNKWREWADQVGIE
ncbi:arylsulfatase [Fodinibius salsisoli]|uniref:Arylsulfatase n=1 Tax=Fodinibius salsisoli TaxID=2820877 RepID=A0ABT3PKZ0_9BACT|nr:arylsulfatase [Fodinibius salsisoli]MCW9706597.1 arylsulfatase [Fodinibius salsisoli]